jgi:hypothetical protein
MDRPTSGAAVLAILMPSVSWLALMHPSLALLAIVIAVVAVLICLSPP